MPLLNITEVCEGIRLGLWRMEEEPEELLSGFPHLRLLEMPYKYPARQKEFLCVRALLLAMTGDPTLHIEHTASGRPVVKGWQVSISHTKGYAALMLSRAKTVGVDIEYRSDRVAKIASHYIRPDEMVGDFKSPTTETVEKMLVLWCAKETLYKLHSDDNLAYFDMRAVEQQGELILENMKQGKRVTIHVIPAQDYVLTWAVDEL